MAERETFCLLGFSILYDYHTVSKNHRCPPIELFEFLEKGVPYLSTPAKGKVT